ncbi:uncharacterized protein [Apostichopus japonicus]|uniref:uncharacterized protein n=1 Tax=Stichopus japonicus TaxID=307972 RepID=UPI003AB81703
MECCSRNKAVSGCLIFAALYMLSGVTMTTTGILAMIRLPIIFKTGSVIWAGILVTGMGLLTVAIIVCKRNHDYRKAVALLLVSVVVLVVCFINLILFEMMEWKEIFGPRLELVNPHQTDLTAIFFAHLVSLVSTVVGLVSSLVGSIYICCVVMTDCNAMDSKNIDQTYGDPEMCKHKYLTTSPPRFGDPSPRSVSGRVQNVGRLSSWSFEGPVSVTNRASLCETSAVLSDVTEEFEKSVCQVENASPVVYPSGRLETITECTAESSSVVGIVPEQFQDAAPPRREINVGHKFTKKYSPLEILSTRL